MPIELCMPQGMYLSLKHYDLFMNMSYKFCKIHTMKNSHLVCSIDKGIFEKLTIAVVSETYPPEINGVALTVQREINGLLGRGHSIQLIRPRQGISDEPVHNGLFEEILSKGMGLPHYEGLRMGFPMKATLLDYWTNKRPDIIHIATEGPLGYSAIQAAKKLNLPVSTTFHTNFHQYSRHYGASWLERPVSAFLRYFHNRTQCTMVPTEQIRQELEESGYHKLQVLPRGIDCQLFSPVKRNMELRQKYGIGDNELTVLHVGRLAPEKNLTLLLETFEAMLLVHPTAKMILVGDGPKRSQIEGLNSQIIFAGIRRDESLAEYYASADIFLFPSLTETFGNVTLEAMASGLAVLAFNYAAAAQHIRHGKNGLLADCGNPEDFIFHACKLISHPEMVHSLGMKARHTVEPLDWSNVMIEFEEVLRKIIRGYALSKEACL